MAIDIWANSDLTSLDGLSNIEPQSITELIIEGNGQLLLLPQSICGIWQLQMQIIIFLEMTGVAILLHKSRMNVMNIFRAL